MALKMQQLLSAVQVYGAPLYASEPTTALGTIDTAGQYPVQDGNLVIESEQGVSYIPIRTATLEAKGFNADTHMFSVGIFTALRDASGEFEGKEWSVAQGAVKTFAY